MSDIPSIALAESQDAVYLVGIGATGDDDDLSGIEPGGTLPERARPVDLVPDWATGRLVDVDSVGSTIVLVLDRRPPLMISHDGGSTWTERGGGLPPGRAVALGENPDHVLYGARNRLYLSSDGGRFWRAIGVELPEVRGVSWG